MSGRRVKRSSRGGIVETPARAIVGTVRWISHRKLIVSCVALALVLVLGVGYLTLGSLKINPFKSKMEVRVALKQSGGLLPNQDVTLRGVRVGVVKSVDLTPDGVIATASIDGGTKIPQGGSVRVAGLSAAGEQYLDFRPKTNDGKFLANGDLIPAEQTTTPTTLADLLGDLNGTLQQIDPQKLKAVVQELGVSDKGPDKLAAIIDGGTYLLSTLDGVLPQTMSLLNTSKTVLGTLDDVAPGLQDTSKNLTSTLSGVEAMTGGFKTLTNTGPRTLTSIDNLFADNSSTMVALFGNLTVTAKMANEHVPALKEFFFPLQREGSTLDAINLVFHDGYIWASASIYPRYSCDYNLPRGVATDPSYSEPYINTYCPNPDPNILIRGARNAPRPPGSPNATAPPGLDPLAQTDPTPKGRFSIDTSGPSGGWAP